MDATLAVGKEKARQIEIMGVIERAIEPYREDCRHSCAALANYLADALVLMYGAAGAEDYLHTIIGTLATREAMYSSEGSA